MKLTFISKLIIAFAATLLSLTAAAADSSNFKLLIENCNEGGSCSLLQPLDYLPEQFVLSAPDTFYTQPSRKHVIPYEQTNRLHLSGVLDAVLLRQNEPAPAGYFATLTFNDSYPVFDQDSRRIWQNGWKQEHIYTHARNDAITYILYIKPLNGEKIESILLDSQDAIQPLVSDGWTYAGKITDRILNENAWDKHVLFKVSTPTSAPPQTNPGYSNPISPINPIPVDQGVALNPNTPTTPTTPPASQPPANGSGNENNTNPTNNNPTDNSSLTNHDGGSNGGHGSYHRTRPSHFISITAVSAENRISCGEELTFTLSIRNAGKVREDDVSVEILNSELGIYNELNRLMIIPQRTIVEDVNIEIPTIYESGEYSFTIRVAYNGVVTDVIKEDVYIEACVMPQLQQIIEPEELVETKIEPAPAASEVIALEPEPGSVRKITWFWPIFGILCLAVIGELVGFKGWSYCRKKKQEQDRQLAEIEEQAQKFTEKDRLY